SSLTTGMTSAARCAALPSPVYRRLTERRFPRGRPHNRSGLERKSRDQARLAQFCQLPEYCWCWVLASRPRQSSADRRLAHAAPRSSAARRHDDRLDGGHLGDAHRVVGVEIGLLDAAVFHRALLIEHEQAQPRLPTANGLRFYNPKRRHSTLGYLS